MVIISNSTAGKQHFFGTSSVLPEMELKFKITTQFIYLLTPAVLCVQCYTSFNLIDQRCHLCTVRWITLLAVTCPLMTKSSRKILPSELHQVNIICFEVYIASVHLNSSQTVINIMINPLKDSIMYLHCWFKFLIGTFSGLDFALWLVYLSVNGTQAWDFDFFPGPEPFNRDQNGKKTLNLVCLRFSVWYQITFCYYKSNL